LFAVREILFEAAAVLQQMAPLAPLTHIFRRRQWPPLGELAASCTASIGGEEHCVLQFAGRFVNPI